MSTSFQLEVYTQSYGHPKLRETQFWEFQDFHLGVLRQNDIWVWVPWPHIENTIRERWWLPPSLGHGESCESVFARGSSVHQKCSNHVVTNLFGLCNFVWAIDLFVILLSPHLGALAPPSTPKMLRAREHAPTPYSSVVFTLDSHLNLLRSLGLHQPMCLAIFFFSMTSLVE